MRKILLFLVLVLVLAGGYLYFFYEPSSHTNQKYNFKFDYANGVELESKGNLFTCGNSNDCASFLGSPNFSYSVWDKADSGFLGAIGTDYKYEMKNGKVYNTSLNPPYNSSLATPFLINKYGIEFYYTESGMMPHYCTFKEIQGQNSNIRICIYESSPTSFDNKPATGSWLTALETFRFK